jgi:hypothetical protein
MPEIAPRSCTAFAGHARIASGRLADVALAAKAAADRGALGPLLIFDDATSRQIEVDLRGTAKDVLARLSKRFAPAQEVGSGQASAPQRKAGRPRLGVIGREVTLLPRHWEWLAEQPGGASVAIRRLIDAEIKSNNFNGLSRKIRETTYRFMHAVAGDFPHFEDASDALFAGDRNAFARLTDDWPADVRDHARWLMSGGAMSDDAGIDV